MSRSLGARLPGTLLEALSQRDLPSRLGRAVPLVTVDEAGRPHPMLCSYLELLAPSPDIIRLVIAGQSGSARNLEARRAATLVFVEPERTMYVKGRATGARCDDGAMARFTLAVEDVLEDTPSAWEGGVQITAGIGYAPRPDLDSAQARATLALLRRDAA